MCKKTFSGKNNDENISFPMINLYLYLYLYDASNHCWRSASGGVLCGQSRPARADLKLSTVLAHAVLSSRAFQSGIDFIKKEFLYCWVLAVFVLKQFEWLMQNFSTIFTLSLFDFIFGMILRLFVIGVK